MKYRLKNEQIEYYNETESPQFPTYTKDFINLANRYSQATRPKNVGQLSDIFPDFLVTSDEKDIDSWKNWYETDNPGKREAAINRIEGHLKLFKEALECVNRELIETWIDDLMFAKTAEGFYFQRAILSHLAELNGEEYRMATAEEESKGIDGYVGDVAYSVKSESYKKDKNFLQEEIPAKMIYYKKAKKSVSFDVEE